MFFKQMLIQFLTECFAECLAECLAEFAQIRTLGCRLGITESLNNRPFHSRGNYEALDCIKFDLKFNDAEALGNLFVPPIGPSDRRKQLTESDEQNDRPSDHLIRMYLEVDAK